MSPGTKGMLDLDSISSCLSIYVKQQNAFRAISLIKKVEMNIILEYLLWALESMLILIFIMCLVLWEVLKKWRCTDLFIRFLFFAYGTFFFKFTNQFYVSHVILTSSLWDKQKRDCYPVFRAKNLRGISRNICWNRELF